MQMKTSVIMTVYNGSKYLLEMLESLRKQTRAIDELLIFDDRSTDSSQMIIKTYISKYRLNNWKLVVNKENKGWEKNFTDGISTATGDIIFPCDQDDIWHLDKIEKMSTAFENNDDILLLVSGYHAFSENGGKMATQQNVRTESEDIVSKIVFDEKYYQILRPGCTMAFRKEIMPAFKTLWEERTPHDALLWTIASIQQRLYLYQGTFIEYRRHDSNASKNISHGYKYKVNEIERTALVNEWYLSTYDGDLQKRKTIECCTKWCTFRKKLIVDKKLVYWIRLWPLKKYYLKPKKYLGDLYYYLVRLGMKE